MSSKKDGKFLQYLRDCWIVRSRVAIRDGPAGQQPRNPACKGHYDVTGIIRFPPAKVCFFFFGKLSAIRACALKKMFVIPVLGPKRISV